MVKDADWVVSRAKIAASALGKTWDARLERILRFCAANPDRLPNIRSTTVKAADLTTMSEQDADAYLKPYVNAYYLGRESNVVAVPDPKTVADPAVDDVLRAFTDISADDLVSLTKYHRTAMQAENVVGTMLEQYIATLLETKGWVWCCGEVVKSVDFIKDVAGGERLLQVKNRSNSENSSSSTVRAGTKIEKWHRVNAYNGKTNWGKLPDNDGTLTEEGFRQFIADCGTKAKVVVTGVEAEEE